MPETIRDGRQFEDTPRGWAQRWAIEFQAANREFDEYKPRGEAAIDRYLDKNRSQGYRLNLFHGDVETRKALLYGNTPKVNAKRRYADAGDDRARVSATMLERLLNTDIERGSDGFRTAIALARDDRLLPGLGVVRHRYVVDWTEEPEQPAQTDPDGNELAPAVPARQVKSNEDVETDYVPWTDFRWSPARFWDEVRWIAFKASMTRDEAHKRFDGALDGATTDAVVSQIPAPGEKDRKSDAPEDPWERIEVWEVWCKEYREVFWYVPGFPVILDRKPDPLGLDNFWPCPKPLFANTTSEKLIPVPDLALNQDSYDEVDRIYAKRSELIDAVRVAGLFDASSPEAKQLVGGKGNAMYPAANMAALAEKGGINSAVLWFPIEPVVNAIAVLTEKLREAIALKDQATGIMDVMRGQGTPGGGVTATERRIQARFGSTRLQAAQDEFARFVTEAQQIRAEIIAKWFDPETIIQRSNVENTADAQLAPVAAQLLKDEHSRYRIEVSTDTLAMTDYDAVKQERIEVIGALATLLGAAPPLVQMGGPKAAEFVLETAGWLMAGTKGGATLEGTFDRFKTLAQQAANAPRPPPQPDPKVQQAQIGLETAKVKGQVEMAKAKTDMQATAMDAQLKQAEHGMRMQELKAETVRDVAAAAVPRPFQTMPGRLEEGR